jgi:hypothetical protein
MSIFEAIMLICFGLAWPVNIYKSLKSRTTKGKSVAFLMAVQLGYVSGIINKILYSRDIVMVLYIINLIMVSIDVGIYFVNRARERAGK